MKKGGGGGGGGEGGDKGGGYRWTRVVEAFGTTCPRTNHQLVHNHSVILQDESYHIISCYVRLRGFGQSFE